MLYRLYFSLWASEAEAREVRPSDVEIVPSSAKAPVYNELHIISVEAIHEILFILYVNVSMVSYPYYPLLIEIPSMRSRVAD